MKTGPDIVTDGLVFGYDTHDYSRFYNGPATTNHLLSLTQSWGNTIRTNGKAVAGTEEVNIPTIGKRTVKYVEYYNNYNNGNDLGCCPNLFNYHSGGTVPLVGNQSYTYSIVYKHTGGYTHPNFMYRYRYKSDATYIGEGGLHSTARRTHLGDGWYHAWGSWTTDADANYGRFYSFLYNYGTDVERFYVAAISLVKNNSGATHLIIPPNLLLEPNTSISTTQSIIDLKKDRDIDTSYITFDSTGQPEMDGTDDYVDLGSDVEVSSVSNAASNGWTAEYVFNTDSASTLQHFNGCEEDVHNAGWLALLSSKLAVWNRSPGVWKYGSTTFASNTWYHIAFVQVNSTTMKFYVNGVAEGGDHVSYSWNASKSAFFARYVGKYEYGGYSRYFNGHIPVTRLYSKALTATQIKQNFKIYKKRFDI
tara:strand:+ start:734 stop:1993 length:1260 start_codon:yes stop_codon:yes gene_type:complete